MTDYVPFLRKQTCGQSNLTKGRIADAHGLFFNRIRHVAPICTRHWPSSLAHTSVSCANSISFGPVPLTVSMCVIVPTLLNIGRTVDEIWLFNGFQHCGRPPSWNFLKLDVLLAVRVNRVSTRHHATFRSDQSSRC